MNVRPQKKQRYKPGALDDVFASWTPVSDADISEVHAVADTVSTLDVTGDDNTTMREASASATRVLHQLTPLHCLTEWNGECWTEATLWGTVPNRAGLTGRSMVVMDVTGIHTIEFQYCGCDKATQTNNLGQLLGNAWYPATTVDPETCATFQCLEAFRLLNVVGNVTAHDYVGTLERLTDPLHLAGLPDRYKGFGRMARQYGFLQRAKRAGRAHETNGLQTTKPGGLAVLCWACPHDGKNLPDGWKDVAPKYRFLYMLLLALDANFRLKNRLRANEHEDPSLGPGLGYFVAQGAYKEHLRNYVAEKDFLYRVRGAAAEGNPPDDGFTGVGRGGWQVHLREHAKKIAQNNEGITTNLDDYEIHVKRRTVELPVGVGRTDGEGIERTWAVLNPVGFSTKEMGEGARHDAIENKVDHLNFEKNTGQGKTLARKLIVAIAERDKQVAAFKDVDSTLEHDLRNDWKKQIDDWLVDRSKPNPYCLEGGKSAGPTEAAVLKELKEAEAQDAAEGRAPVSETRSTPSAFMKAGLQLEESQRRIKAEVKGVTLVTADRSSQIQELRMVFLRKLRTFEKLQAVYMPGVAALREAAEEARDPERLPPKAEDIKLWLPSDIPAVARRAACARGIPEMEAKLRAAQCVDSLNNLRSRLHAQKHLTTWRNSNSVGQRAATRSATLIGRIGDRIARERTSPPIQGAEASRHERQSGGGERFRVEAEAGALGKLETDADRAYQGDENLLLDLDGRRGPGRDMVELHNSVRVEWSKARARRDRWVEEVQILWEEMKRVLRFLRWVQDEWEHMAKQRTEVDPQLAAGLKAYALRQQAVHRRIAEGFHAGWNVSVATAVREIVRQDGTVYRDLLSGQEMDRAPVEVGLEEVEENVGTESGTHRTTRSAVAADAAAMDS
ncbi:hypothetical protein B0H13DRAFT_2341227 [Mycena leptocephala]|nr:hypothetical protein B0H13DRAFT_2341227 [Mycena leptocephala]